MTNALRWRMWPDEKPEASKWYLVEEKDTESANRPFDDRLGMEWYNSTADKWITKGLRVLRWTEVPEPKVDD